jgi:hypothetical protein
LKLLAKQIALIAIVLAACPVATVPITRAAQVAAAGLTDAERTLLEQNPALADLAETAPSLLTKAFELIARAAAEPSTDQRGVEGLDEADARLLGSNPALLQVWRSSPEASADLLALIKTAAGGGGKPQK